MSGKGQQSQSHHENGTQACVAVDRRIGETAARTMTSAIREIPMTKTLTAILFASAMTMASANMASAMEKMKCDDDAMMKVEMMMKEHKGDKMKMESAMKENDMAAMAKKDGKMDECAMHLNMAAESLMK
jgi:hypothetical protein